MNYSFVDMFRFGKDNKYDWKNRQKLGNKFTPLERGLSRDYRREPVPSRRYPVSTQGGRK